MSGSDTTTAATIRRDDCRLNQRGHHCPPPLPAGPAGQGSPPLRGPRAARPPVTWSDSPIPALTSAGSQATTRLRPGRLPIADEHREHLVRGQAVGVHYPGRRWHVLRLDLEHGDGARRAAALRGVDEDEQVAAAEQLVDQVHAADAEVRDLRRLRPRPAGQQPDHLDAEGVVALEDVADPGDQRPALMASSRPGSRGTGSTSSGEKYRNRPCAACRSAAGSSARVTAR